MTDRGLESGATALDIAAAVREGRVRAVEVAEAAIGDIRRRDPQFNSFTEITAERAPGGDLREAVELRGATADVPDRGFRDFPRARPAPAPGRRHGRRRRPPPGPAARQGAP